MREPEWIEHDGSKGCPVPAGHDVEVRFRNGKTSRDCCPEGWVWHHWTIKSGNVTHYRDWTAFEQQNGEVEVPEWAKKRAGDLVGSGHTFIAFARYIAAHEPEPVDPLRELIDNVPDEEIRHIADSKDVLTCRRRIEDVLRARGVTMEKNNV